MKTVEYSDKPLNIPLHLFLSFFTLGFWNIYLIFRWSKYLNYLDEDNTYNPKLLAAIIAFLLGGGLITVYFDYLFLSWVFYFIASLLSIYLARRLAETKLLTGDIKEKFDSLFRLSIILFIATSLLDLITYRHDNCSSYCFFCFLQDISIIITVAFYGIVLWLFNAVVASKNTGINLSIISNSYKKLWIWIVIVSSVFLCLFHALNFSQSSFHEPTIAEFQESFEHEVNSALESPSHELRRRIEKAHASVSVHTAYISGCRITTKDGSHNAGVDGSNIRRIDLEITTRWDGIIHKNGYTVIGITIENIKGEAQMTDAKIISTNALVNMEDPEFWLDVGSAVIMLM